MAKNGRLIDISLTSSPIKDSNGKIIGASKIARNISLQKETEAAALVSLRFVCQTWRQPWRRDRCDTSDSTPAWMVNRTLRMSRLPLKPGILLPCAAASPVGPRPGHAPRFRGASSGWQGDWHPTPQRQFFVYLSGGAGVEASDGEIRHFRTGDVLFVEDTTGKGHRSWVETDEEIRVSSSKYRNEAAALALHGETAFSTAQGVESPRTVMGVLHGSCRRLQAPWLSPIHQN